MNNISMLIRISVALSGLFAASSFAAAALPASAHVVQIRVDSNGQGMIFFDQTFVGTPAACGQDSVYKSALAFNATTGKAALAMALAAKATGATVAAYGTGACSVYGDFVEDFAYGVIQ
jgi:hypothetical protein